MTLDDAVKVVYRRWEQSISYPTSGTEEYTIITGALNDAIEAWGGRAKEESTQWKELFVNLSDASSGTKTTTVSDTTYSAPTDFVEISSWVKITDSTGSLYYEYVEPNDVMRRLKENSGDRFFWITGKEGSRVININPAPSATGDTIEYSYYKLPSTLSSTTDTFEMSRPYFAIYFALASLNESERPDLALTYSSRAKSIMDEMIIANEIPPFGHPTKMRDFDFDDNGGIAFGRVE